MSLGSIQWGSAFSMSLFGSAFQVKSRHAEAEDDGTTAPPSPEDGAEKQPVEPSANTIDTLSLTTEAEASSDDARDGERDGREAEKRQRHRPARGERPGSVSIDAAAFSYRTQSLFGSRGNQGSVFGGANVSMSLANMVVEHGDDTLEISEEALKEQEEAEKSLSEKIVEKNENEAETGSTEVAEPAPETVAEPTDAAAEIEPGSGTEAALPNENTPGGLADLFRPETVGAFFSGEMSFEEEITTALGIDSSMGKLEYEMSASEDGFHFSMLAGSSNMSVTEDGFTSEFSGRALDVGLHRTEDGGIEMTFSQVTRTETVTVSRPGRGRGHGRPVEGRPHPSRGNTPPPKQGRPEASPEPAPPAGPPPTEEPPVSEETESTEATEATSPEDGEETPPAESSDEATSESPATIGDIFEAIDGILAGLMSLAEESGGSIAQSMTSQETAAAFGPFRYSSSTATESYQITLPEGAWSELFAAPEEPSPEETAQQNGMPDLENQQIVAPPPEAVVPKQPPATTLEADEEESAEDASDDDEETVEEAEMVA